MDEVNSQIIFHKMNLKYQTLKSVWYIFLVKEYQKKYSLYLSLNLSSQINILEMARRNGFF